MKIEKSDYEALLRFRNMIRRYIRFTDKGARAVGLTPQQHQLLLVVKGQPGRDWASVSDIAEALQLKHNTAGGLIDRCEQAGLVARSSGEKDRRRVEVRLTSRGEEILAGLSERNLAELRTMRSILDSPE